MKKIAVLYSSGVESSSLMAHYLDKAYEVYPIYVQGGFAYEKEEIQWAKKLWDYYDSKFPGKLKDIKFLELNWDYGRDNEIPMTKKQLGIPLRNMVMFSMAAIYMKKHGLEKLASGILGDDEFPDTNLDYLKRLEALISEGGEMDFHFELPFHGQSKASVIQTWAQVVPFGMTRSCTTMQDDKHCGKCSKCIARKNAFQEAGVQDPTKYIEQAA